MVHATTSHWVGSVLLTHLTDPPGGGGAGVGEGEEPCEREAVGEGLGAAAVGVFVVEGVGVALALAGWRLGVEEPVAEGAEGGVVVGEGVGLAVAAHVPELEGVLEDEAPEEGVPVPVAAALGVAEGVGVREGVAAGGGERRWRRPARRVAWRRQRPPLPPRGRRRKHFDTFSRQRGWF